MRGTRIDGQRRSALLRPYRGPDGKTTSPPWVSSLIDGLASKLENTTGDSEVNDVEVLIAWALKWCNEGASAIRAEQILTVMLNWPGPCNAALIQFLQRVTSMKCGAPATAKDRSPVRPHVLRTWDPTDATPATRDAVHAAAKNPNMAVCTPAIALTSGGEVERFLLQFHKMNLSTASQRPKRGTVLYVSISGLAPGMHHLTAHENTTLRVTIEPVAPR